MDDVNASSSSTRTAEEYDVENADYIAELLCSDVLTSSVGKKCLKVSSSIMFFYENVLIINCFELLYTYLQNNAEWLLQQLNVSDIELSAFKSLPGQNIKEDKLTLLKLMFHIGHQPFDQVPFLIFFLFLYLMWFKYM